MSFERFCAKCGKKTPALIGAVCSECFLKKNDLFDVRDFKIERCNACEKIKVKSNWMGFNTEIINKEVVSKVKLLRSLEQPKVIVELNQLTPLDFGSEISVSGLIDGVLIEQKKPYEFSLTRVKCDSCMKLVSNYREAIIQLRGSSMSESEAMLELVKQFLALEQSKNSLSAIMKILKGSTGYDVWVGSRKGASKVVRKMEKII